MNDFLLDKIFRICIIVIIMDLVIYFCFQIKVIEEAIKYIDELHYALLKKAPQLFGK